MVFLSAFGIREGFIPPAFPAVKFIWLQALVALRAGEIRISTRRWKYGKSMDEGVVFVFQDLILPHMDL